MSKKKKSQSEKGHHFYVSRDRLCPKCLDISENGEVYCNLPHNHDYSCSYTIVYEPKHLDRKNYDCGCLVYHNKYYPEFKFPELIWIDFFKYTIGPGDKLIKFSINMCKPKS